MPNLPTETELKFLIAPDQVDDLRNHGLLRGKSSTVRLRSVYYDTPDLDLRDAGISLRIRQTSEGYVQTVKAAHVGGMSRGEWESPVETEQVDCAALAVTPAAEILRGNAGALAPLFSTTVDRQSRLVKFDGARIEASFDHGDVVCGETSEPIEELELELKSGKASSLFALAGELCRATPIRLSHESKAERGGRLRDGSATAPRKGEAVTLSASMSAMAAFQTIAHACLAQVTANAEVLRRIRRPEALHQLRIGLRRLRTATSIFKSMLANDGQPVDLELEWLAGELDPARDIEVFAMTTFRLAAKAPDKTGLAALGRHLRKAKRQAYDRALAALESRRYATLVLQAAAWIEAGGWTRAEDPLLARLRSVPIAEHRTVVLEHLRHAVRKRGRNLERLDPAARHKLRIRAKRLRYAVEFFVSLSEHPKREAKFLSTLKAMQDQLGELNDIAVGRARLLTDAALKDPAVAFTAGRAVGRREFEEPHLIRAAMKGYRAFESAEPFWT